MSWLIINTTPGIRLKWVCRQLNQHWYRWVHRGDVTVGYGTCRICKRKQTRKLQWPDPQRKGSPRNPAQFVRTLGS